MADIFSSTNPPNTEAVKLGALRIRELKAILQNTLGRIYSLSTTDSTSATVTEISNCISGTMLKSSGSDDTQRAVSTNHIKDTAVSTSKIQDTAVTAAKLAADAVTTAKILDSNVTTAKIADGAVTTAKIADDGVTQAKIADKEICPEHALRPRKWVRFKKVTISAGDLVRTSNVVTATLADHRLQIGDTVFIEGTSGSSFDGTFTVASVPSSSTFTYAHVGSNGSNSGTSGYIFTYAGTSNSLTGSSATVSVSRTLTTVTVTWNSHGLAQNDRVRIAIPSASALNGEWLINYVDTNTFTYTTPTSGSVSATSAVAQKVARDVSSFTATDPSGRATVVVNWTSAFPDLDFAVTASAADSTTSRDFFINAFITSESVLTITLNESGGDTDLPTQLSVIAQA